MTTKLQRGQLAARKTKNESVRIFFLAGYKIDTYRIQQSGQTANEANQSLQAALDQLHTAEEQLGRNQMSGDQGQMMAAETSMNNAEDMYVGMLAKMSGNSGSRMESQISATMSDTARDMKHGQPQGHGAGGKTGVQSSGNGGMMSGADGLGNDMGSTDRDGHSGGMGNSGSGNHESSGHSGGGGM